MARTSLKGPWTSSLVSVTSNIHQQKGWLCKKHPH